MKIPQKFLSINILQRALGEKDFADLMDKYEGAKVFQGRTREANDEDFEMLRDHLNGASIRSIAKQRKTSVMRTYTSIRLAAVSKLRK